MNLSSNRIYSILTSAKRLKNQRIRMGGLSKLGNTSFSQSFLYTMWTNVCLFCWIVPTISIHPSVGDTKNAIYSHLLTLSLSVFWIVPPCMIPFSLKRITTLNLPFTFELCFESPFQLYVKTTHLFRQGGFASGKSVSLYYLSFGNNHYYHHHSRLYSSFDENTSPSKNQINWLIGWNLYYFFLIEIVGSLTLFDLHFFFKKKQTIVISRINFSIKFLFFLSPATTINRRSVGNLKDILFNKKSQFEYLIGDTIYLHLFSSIFRI